VCILIFDRQLHPLIQDTLPHLHQACSMSIKKESMFHMLPKVLRTAT
jgi:hypothetical protein